MSEHSQLSHVTAEGKPGMVDVGGKPATARHARAHMLVRLPESVKALLESGEIQSPKGAVVQTAIVAGTMAVKRTGNLIPFCHPLNITDCTIEIVPDKDSNLVVTCQVACNGATGVEMEALTGASVAALTIYDMCKAISHEMVMTDLRLLEKSGGKSGTWRATS